MDLQWLEDTKENDLEKIGTKAFYQATLKLKDVNVPNGFCITSNFISDLVPLCN